VFSGDTTKDDLVTLYIFHTEFLCHVLRAQISNNLRLGGEGVRTPGIYVVFEVAGLSLGQLNTDVIAYLKTVGDIHSNHYPLARPASSPASTQHLSLNSLAPSSCCPPSHPPSMQLKNTLSSDMTLR